MIGYTKPFFAASALLMATTMPAWAVDWTKVPGKEVVLFYPGQSPWEWVLSQTDHSGAVKFKDGKNCHACHDGEEKSMGATLVSGTKNEPAPIAGKPPFIAATVKMATEGDQFLVRIEYAEGTQPDIKMDAKYASKVTVMFNDGKVAPANRAGCWAACHDDLRNMPSAGTAGRTKYLAASRAKMTRQGGGEDLVPDDQLAKLRADGVNLEYWQALFNPGAPAAANSFTVLDKREDIKANAVTAEAGPSAGGAWAVTLARKLKAGPPYKDIETGKPYTVGFAIHSGHALGRFHYVSFEYSVILGQGNADFVVQ